MRSEPISVACCDTERETLQGKTLPDHPASLRSADNPGKSASNRPILSAVIRNYGLLSGRFHEALPLPVPRRAGGFLFATLATCARSLPVPLDAISPSLHRPLRGTPRCACWHREVRMDRFAVIMKRST